MNKHTPRKRTKPSNSSYGGQRPGKGSGQKRTNRWATKGEDGSSGRSNHQTKGRFKKRKPNSTSTGLNKRRSRGESPESSHRASRPNAYRSSSRPTNGRRSHKRSAGRGRAGVKTIDIQTFIKKASIATPTKQHIIKHTFADFGFIDRLQDNLDKKGYSSPTPIQDQAIHPVMEGRDVIGLANTGTGKTAAFLLPLIHKIANDRSQKLLIIAPTRELAIQIDTEFRMYSQEMKIFSSVCIGGSPMFHQLRSLQRKPNVVIGTPGRLEDLAKRGKLGLKSFNNVVLDEVDRMLDMGFIQIIKSILNETAEDRQLLFFSATLPDSIKKLVHSFLVNPATIYVQTGQTAQNVNHDVIQVGDAATKFDKLTKILEQPELVKVLIFSETKRDVEKLAIRLNQTGFKADSIHGDKRQQQRQRSLSQFRSDKVDILVATDVAARGLDIKDITHVINYTIPQTYNDYIHRIGRTGRGTNKGTALTFV